MSGTKPNNIGGFIIKFGFTFYKYIIFCLCYYLIFYQS